ncbi:YveK family protein [Actinomycetospora sp. NBC_00405]|uniref:YveK family protein n=1 Tax=Actinomycetospora sp. NBC_00405 TaxID=2975952 RepID=UPI002E1F4E30
MRTTLTQALDRAVRRWWLVVVLGLIGLAVGGIYAATTPRTYSTSSYVTVAALDPNNSQAALGFAQAFGRIATAPQVLNDASALSGIPVPELATSSRTSTSPDAPLIEITTRSVDAQRATNGANAIAGVFANFANLRTPDTGMRVAVLSDAAVPVVPSSISTGAVLAIGTGAGVLLGALAVAAGMGRLHERSREPGSSGDAAAWRPPSPGVRSARTSPRPTEPGDPDTAGVAPRVPSPRPGSAGSSGRPDPVRRLVDLEPSTIRVSVPPSMAAPSVAAPSMAATAGTRSTSGTNGDSAPTVATPPVGDEEASSPATGGATTDAVQGDREPTASSTPEAPDEPDAEGKDRAGGGA